MNFTKSLIWIGGATSISLLTQFIVAKIVATYLSVSDFGVIGQYLSLISILQLLGGGVFSAGVTRFIADYNYNQQAELFNFYSTAFTIVVFFSVIITCFLALFASPLSQIIFFSQDYVSIVIFTALCAFPYNFFKLIISSLSGFSRFVAYGFYSGILSITILFLVLLVFYYHFNINSVLLSFSIAYIILIPVGFYYHNQISNGESIKRILNSFSLFHAKKLIYFSLMPMIVMLLGPISQIVIRNIINSSASWDVVGQWQAVNKISDAYIMIMSMIFSNYFMPSIAKTRSIKEIKKAIYSFSIRIIPFAVIILTICCLFKYWIVLLLYSEDYVFLETKLPVQFIGDFFRIIGFISVYVLIAKVQVFMFTLIEVISTFLMIALSAYGFYLDGLDGLILFYSINALLFMITGIVFLFVYLSRYSIEGNDV